MSILVLAALSGTALAQKSLTARQLFMLLPNEYINGTKQERSGAIIFPKSVTAEFLPFMVSGTLVPSGLAGDFAKPEGLGAMRVFRKRSSIVVGLRYQLGDEANPNQSVDTVKIVTTLLEYKGGKWSDVTSALLPVITPESAQRTLQGFPETKDVKLEDVWVETQVSQDRNGLLLVGRVKGSEAVTPLKFFKWNGERFMESE